jgi:hypothetical protein
MQQVSSAISYRYMWVGVASHLLTYRNTNPSLSLPLFLSQTGWQDCVHQHQACAWTAWVCACVACGVGVREFMFSLFFYFFLLRT